MTKMSELTTKMMVSGRVFRGHVKFSEVTVEMEQRPEIIGELEMISLQDITNEGSIIDVTMSSIDKDFMKKLTAAFIFKVNSDIQGAYNIAMFDTISKAIKENEE